MYQSALRRVRAVRAGEAGAAASGESGFTLIELMVVLLIMGILLAIAIPTFLGVSGSAKDKAAQTNTANSLLNAKAYYTNGSTYNGLLLSAATTGGVLLSTSPLVSGEPAISFVNGSSSCAATSPNCVSADVFNVSTPAATPAAQVAASLAQGYGNGDGGGAVFAAYSTNNGLCWFIADLTSAPTALATTTAVPSPYWPGGMNWSPGAAKNAQVQVINSAVETTAATQTAGTFYAVAKITAASCTADYPFTDTADVAATPAPVGFHWYQTFGAASSAVDNS